MFWQYKFAAHSHMCCPQVHLEKFFQRPRSPQNAYIPKAFPLFFLWHMTQRCIIELEHSPWATINWAWEVQIDIWDHSQSHFAFHLTRTQGALKAAGSVCCSQIMKAHYTISVLPEEKLGNPRGYWWKQTNKQNSHKISSPGMSEMIFRTKFYKLDMCNMAIML